LSIALWWFFLCVFFDSTWSLSAPQNMSSTVFQTTTTPNSHFPASPCGHEPSPAWLMKSTTEKDDHASLLFQLLGERIAKANDAQAHEANSRGEIRIGMVIHNKSDADACANANAKENEKPNESNSKTTDRANDGAGRDDELLSRFQRRVSIIEEFLRDMGCDHDHLTRSILFDFFTTGLTCPNRAVMKNQEQW